MVSHQSDGYSRRGLEYASAEDFCRIFHQDMDVLYWLALTLTGEAGNAERCFLAGLDECREGNAVFKEWARSWTRRVVIKNAIRLVSPASGATGSPAAVRLQEKLTSPAEVALAALANLQPFDRFIFVMSVLEGYADRDCATLLACSIVDVIAARLKALQEIGRTLQLSPTLQGTNHESQASAALSEAEVA